jgi:hypothetical protein
MTFKITKDKLEGLITKEGQKAKIGDMIAPIRLSNMYDAIPKISEENLQKYDKQVLKDAVSRGISLHDMYHNIDYYRKSDGKNPVENIGNYFIVKHKL